MDYTDATEGDLLAEISSARRIIRAEEERIRVIEELLARRRGQSTNGGKPPRKEIRIVESTALL